MRKTKQQIAVEALIRKHQPLVQKAFIEAIQKSRGNIDLKALKAALESGDIQSALALFRLDAGVMYPLQDAIRAAYGAGGASVAKQLPRAIQGTFGFNGSHPRAEQWARTIGSEAITAISQGTIEAAQEIITTGLQSGRGTNSIARDLVGKVVRGNRVGGVMGMTKPMVESTNMARDKLASGNAADMREYLDLKLRDRRYDSVVKAAIKSGKPIPKATLTEIYRAHQQKSVTYRGKVVARNEVFMAQAAGRDEAYRQLADKPGIEKVTKRWQWNLSRNPREDHQVMSGTVVDHGEDFVFSDGVQMSYPHDPRGGPEHIINCRCVAVYRVVVPKG